MNKKRSQATIFLILGILLVIIVSALVMLSRYSREKTTNQEAIDVKEAQLDVQPLRKFISECVNIQTKEALTILGGQGGYLYKSQGGTLIDYAEENIGTFFVPYDGKKVAYGILRPRFSAGKYSAKPPQYPWKSFPYEDESRAVEVFEARNVFGLKNIPPLNRSLGPHSVQEQLERFVSNNIDSCLTPEIFEELGFIVDKREKSVKAEINDEDITIKLSYSLDVENIVSGETTKLNEFIIQVPIRFGELHNFVNDLVTKDVSDIRFDIGNRTSRNDFVVNVIRDVYEMNDIITVKDLKTRINGNQYQYIFSRQNRNPAMFYVPDDLTVEWGSNVTNETLIPGYPDGLQALDPDEDVIEKGDFYYYPDAPLGRFLIPSFPYNLHVTDGQLEDNQIIKVTSTT